MEERKQGEEDVESRGRRVAAGGSHYSGLDGDFGSICAGSTIVFEAAVFM